VVEIEEGQAQGEGKKRRPPGRVTREPRDLKHRRGESPRSRTEEGEAKSVRRGREKSHRRHSSETIIGCSQGTVEFRGRGGGEGKTQPGGNEKEGVEQLTTAGKQQLGI